MPLNPNNIFLFTFLFLALACNNSIPLETNSVAGSYRLKYYPEIDNGTGWDYDQIQREELLKINPDSSYTIERIYPQGGFELLPDSGTWQIQNNLLMLHSQRQEHIRSFQFVRNGIIEPECDREDLSDILWTRE